MKMTYALAAAGAGLAVYLGYRWLVSRLPSVEPAAVTPSPAAASPAIDDDALEVTTGSVPQWATHPPRPIGTAPTEFETGVDGATRPGSEQFAAPTTTTRLTFARS